MPNATPPKHNSNTPVAARHVRVRLPETIYREVRHRLVDADDAKSISDVIVRLIEAGLGGVP